jgi:hypothetical protein
LAILLEVLARRLGAQHRLHDPGQDHEDRAERVAPEDLPGLLGLDELAERSGPVMPPAAVPTAITCAVRRRGGRHGVVPQPVTAMTLRGQAAGRMAAWSAPASARYTDA